MPAGDMAAAFRSPPRRRERHARQPQLELATFYDPLVTGVKGGFTPDAARAADWYERAASPVRPKRSAASGLLLAKGGAGLGADPVAPRAAAAGGRPEQTPKPALDALLKQHGRASSNLIP